MNDEELRALERLSSVDPARAAQFIRAQLRNGQLTQTAFLVPEHGSSPTYAHGLKILRQNVLLAHLLAGIHPSIRMGKELLARPLTFKETIRARVDQYLLNKGRTTNDLFSNYLDTCTAIITEGGKSTRFKIIQNCGLLSALSESHRASFIAADYRAVVGQEFDFGRSMHEYTHTPLGKETLWLALLDGDSALLEQYFDIITSSLVDASIILNSGSRPGMLWPVRISGEDVIFSKFDDAGTGMLNTQARFVRMGVTPRKPI